LPAPSLSYPSFIVTVCCRLRSFGVCSPPLLRFAPLCLVPSVYSPCCVGPALWTPLHLGVSCSALRNTGSLTCAVSLGGAAFPLLSVYLTRPSIPSFHVSQSSSLPPSLSSVLAVALRLWISDCCVLPLCVLSCVPLLLFSREEWEWRALQLLTRTRPANHASSSSSFSALSLLSSSFCLPRLLPLSLWLPHTHFLLFAMLRSRYVVCHSVTVRLLACASTSVCLTV